MADADSGAGQHPAERRVGLLQRHGVVAEHGHGRQISDRAHIPSGPLAPSSCARNAGELA